MNNVCQITILITSISDDNFLLYCNRYFKRRW